MRVWFLAFVSAFAALVIPCSAWCERALPFFNQSDLSPYWLGEDTQNSGTSVNVPAALKSFHATDQNGKEVTEKSLEGKISLVNFFFGQCGSVCPVMMNSIQRFQKEQKKLGERISFQIYSFSTTPDTDSPRVLRRYAKSRRLDLSNWSLLTGEKSQIYRLGRQVFKADRSIGSQQSDATFIHSSNIYLVDEKLRIRGIYDTGNSAQMAALQKDLVQLAK